MFFVFCFFLSRSHCIHFTPASASSFTKLHTQHSLHHCNPPPLCKNRSSPFTPGAYLIPQPLLSVPAEPHPLYFSCSLLIVRRTLSRTVPLSVFPSFASHGPSRFCRGPPFPLLLLSPPPFKIFIIYIILFLFLLHFFFLRLRTLSLFSFCRAVVLHLSPSPVLSWLPFCKLYSTTTRS
ncbi:hypothetical protein BKA62DRAFT_512986 [Auriculariales sp. MPI-PUGE-AT-0066]|nr:hypothetical protein BKA62DRAFT_512986 [Auriculariales sp. MPI-PUGE-AT-0066]